MLLPYRLRRIDYLLEHVELTLPEMLLTLTNSTLISVEEFTLETNRFYEFVFEAFTVRVATALSFLNSIRFAVFP